MKTLLNKKATWQFLLSVVTLGIFILFALGSILDDFMKYNIEYLGNGIYKETNYYGDDKEIITGRVDKTRRMEGPVKIEHYNSNNFELETEEVNMVGGRRHGESKTTCYFYGANGYQPFVFKHKYNMGFIIYDDPPKSEYGNKADVSTFQVLGKEYPWFLLKLNVFGFDTAYVETYLEALETKLNAYVYDISKFDEYYGDVIDELEETPYDSIITLNSQLTMFQGLASMKNAEFRLAIIDRYLSSGSSTYNIISTTYPGYLLTMNTKEVNNEDFRVFCQDMDSRMNSYGALNKQDPFYIDSVDARMFRAILDISDAGKSSSKSAEPSLNSILLNFKNHDINDIYDEILQMLKPSLTKSTPKEVASIVVNDMLLQYYIPSEIINMAAKEAYFIKGGVKRFPTATTVFENTNSSTSVSLKGYVIEDGGAAVTSRGIAWATFYNPTNSNNLVSSGTGTGQFNVTLSGLTPGTTYYARTYATNSAGTAYGNCISFNTNITTAINDVKPLFTQDFSIYPNPASSSVTLSFKLEAQGKIQLTVIDMKGQIVIQNASGNLQPGENEIQLNISDLQNGLYTCILNNGKSKVMEKLLIAR